MKSAGTHSSFILHPSSFFDRLGDRRVVLFGGKGGVGKTTLSSHAAIHFAATRPTILFTTDPASNLGDVFREQVNNLTIESLDADALYSRFLGENLESFLELGDRGTYLDREELRRFFELSLPGVDELMAWMRIGELAEKNRESMLIVDTAPTGHTLRMLGASEHFAQMASALDSMQAKHRGMVRQFTRRNVRDAMDAFIEEFDARAERRRALLTDKTRTAFVPVMLSEPWVVEQTLRLIAELPLDVPFVILNRAAPHDDDARCAALRVRDADAHARLASREVVDVKRFCPAAECGGGRFARPGGRSGRLHTKARLLFLAGKGGVGKTTSAASIALQFAKQQPDKRFVVISVDPAHTLRDVFAHENPPDNLSVETIDTRAKWRAFRESLGDEIDRVIDGLAPKGLSVAYDGEAMKKLVEIAPPGADELFAITRLADLIADETIERIVVDTAPTGHFLRLVDLPKSAGEWVREFMRILLHYRELVPPGSLGEELIRASRALTSLSETLRSDDATVLAVTRPEPIVIAETKRLIAAVEERGMRVGGIIANYVTPESDCPCDRDARAQELTVLASLEREVITIERADAPVTSLDALAILVPLAT
ncbi:MAG: arsenite/tail-anchored protein-transporting ATPase [Acidobacteriota bacterium]|jgi:arsenite-transporting ATPase|nr:arsenite/tail-anchored protein-transporting ATPase [Acidobacteriota bacterium]